MAREFYTDEEADAILRLASQRSSAFGISRERLLATASELGITEEEVEEAEQSVLTAQREQRLRAEYAREVRSDFTKHAITYLAVNSFLILLDLYQHYGVKISWSLIPAIGWGIGLALHFHSAFNSQSAEYERDYQQWTNTQKRRKFDRYERASVAVRKYLRSNPNDRSGAIAHLRDNLRIGKREASMIVEQELFN